MNRCKTCKWWGSVPDWMQYPPPAGGCCQNYDKFLCGDGETYPDDALVMIMGDMSVLWTGPEFGCVHHEMKG